MEQGRGQWGSRLGFVLAASGSAIGLGNLWKFPYVTWQNQGGGFVLLYVLCVATVGLPIMTAEILIGRRTQKSAVVGMREAAGRPWAWVGRLGVLAGFVILGYYLVVAGWTFRYFARCVSWSLNGYAPGDSSPADFASFTANGWLQVGLAGAFMAATMVVNLAGVGGGIERVSRALMPALFAILVLLLGSALTMPGAGEALRFTFVPVLANLPGRGVLEALGQAFFSLSLGMGAMITYGSYISRKESVVRSAVWVVALDTLIAITAAVIMFSVIFSIPGFSERMGRSTAGMLFITLPELFYTVVPLGQLLAPLFYVLVAFAALTSTISLLEVTVSNLIDEYGWTRRRATLFCAAACYLVSILCALSLGASGVLSGFEVFAGKQGVFATLDHLAANWMLPVGGLLITLAAGWVMSPRDTRAELLDETAPRYFRYGAWQFLIRFLAPAAVLAIIGAVALGFADFT